MTKKSRRTVVLVAAGVALLLWMRRDSDAADGGDYSADDVEPVRMPEPEVSIGEISEFNGKCWRENPETKELTIVDSSLCAHLQW